MTITFLSSPPLILLILLSFSTIFSTVTWAETLQDRLMGRMEPLWTTNAPLLPKAKPKPKRKPKQAKEESKPQPKPEPPKQAKEESKPQPKPEPPKPQPKPPASQAESSSPSLRGTTNANDKTDNNAAPAPPRAPPAPAAPASAAAANKDNNNKKSNNHDYDGLKWLYKTLNLETHDAIYYVEDNMLHSFDDDVDEQITRSNKIEETIYGRTGDGSINHSQLRERTLKDGGGYDHQDSVFLLYQDKWEYPFVPDVSLTDYCNTKDCDVSIPTHNPPKRGVSPNVLLDGVGQGSNNDPLRSIFFDVKLDSNRILIDLKKSIPVREINSYSWHLDTRANQRHDIYYYNPKNDNDKTHPPCDSNVASHDLHKKEGWNFLCRVWTPFEKYVESQVGVTVRNITKNAKLMDAQYILIDVHGPSTFYGEFDVYAAEA